MLTFLVNGTRHEYDDDRLMFSEAMEIQRATGLSAAAFETGLKDGDAVAFAGLFWLAELRARVAANPGTTLKDAVAALPFGTWDVNLSESIRSLSRVEQPDPTPPAATPDGSEASTSPATSEPQPVPTPSPSAEPATSEFSPSSSASAPGSGTA